MAHARAPVSRGKSNWRVSASRGRGGAKTADGSTFELDCRPLATPPPPPFWILRIAFCPSPQCPDFFNSEQSIAHQEKGGRRNRAGSVSKIFWCHAPAFRNVNCGDGGWLLNRK